MNQLVFIENNRPVTDSLTVAEVFNKEHARVLRDIRELGCSYEFRVGNFAESTYNNAQGRETPKYVITEQGFTFLVMGYTGRVAMEFKEKYIAEFNRMREQLTINTKALSPELQMLKLLYDATANIELVHAEHDKRLSALESGIARLEDGSHPKPSIEANWRKDIHRLMLLMTAKRGNYMAYQVLRAESYAKLEDQTKCNLDNRLCRRRTKMRREGASKPQVKKASKMDVIADDVRLSEIYLAIVKEMAIQLKVVAS